MTTFTEKSQKKKQKPQWTDLSWTSGEPLVLTAEPPLPMAPGIFADLAPLLADKNDTKRLRTMLGYHTGSIDYLKVATSEGAMRHDFQGQPISPVSEEHKRYVEARLAEIWKQIKQHRSSVDEPSAAQHPASPDTESGGKQVVVARKRRQILTLNLAARGSTAAQDNVREITGVKSSGTRMGGRRT